MPDSQILWSLAFASGVALAVFALFRALQGARLLLHGTRAVGILTRYTVEEHRQWWCRSRSLRSP